MDMTLLLGFIAGFSTNLGVKWVNNLISQYHLEPILEQLPTVYRVVDALISANYKEWDGSKVDRLLEAVVQTFGDGQLSEDEVQKAIQYIVEHYDPRKAIESTKTPLTPRETSYMIDVRKAMGM